MVGGSGASDVFVEEEDGEVEGFVTAILDLVVAAVVFFVVEDDGDLEGTLPVTGLGVPAVVFSVVFTTWPVTAVDACVVGVTGVGCPVIAFPVQLAPSAEMFIPLGQRQVWDLTRIAANRQR